MKLSKRKIKNAMKEAFYSFGAAAALGVVKEEQASFFYSNLDYQYEEAAEWWKENYPTDEEDAWRSGEVRPEGPVFDMCLQAYIECAITVERVFGI